MKYAFHEIPCVGAACERFAFITDQKQDGRPPHIGFGHVGPRRVEQEVRNRKVLYLC